MEKDNSGAENSLYQPVGGRRGKSSSHLAAAAAFGTGALKKAVREGDREQGCFMAGQIAGMLDREQTARDIVEEIALQAENCWRIGRDFL